MLVVFGNYKHNQEKIKAAWDYDWISMKNNERGIFTQRK